LPDDDSVAAPDATNDNAKAKPQTDEQLKKAIEVLKAREAKG
jgi:hypothetical protein